MVVEELIAKLGFKGTGGNEAAKFLEQLKKIKKEMTGLGKGAEFKVKTGTGLGKITADAERATRALRAMRAEAERAGRVRYRPGAGFGPGAFHPTDGRGPGRGPGRTHYPGGGHVVDAAAAGAGVGLGRAGAIGAGAYATGRLAAGSLKSSMDFERSMIEVTKATDATAAERQDYEDKLLRLARDTGQNKEGLAGMLSQAGFSGRPKNELMRFTEFGAKASKAWGTTPEQTGQSMAEIGNIYGANQAEIERISDQINTMADKSASRETDLLEIVRRVGGTGKTSGMSSGDMLAFGAGLKERGVQTEVAASGIESYINFLKLGEDFSGKADEGLKKLGVTSDKLKKNFVKDPTGTAVDFLEKINKLTDPLKRADVLTKIFGKERQDDVERLASSIPKIKEYLSLMKDAKNYQGSVLKQFDEQQKNDVSKIDQAEQQLDVLKKRLGDPLKQAAGSGAEKLNKALDYIDNREGNKSAAPSNAFDDLPGLDGMRADVTGPRISAEAFRARHNLAPQFNDPRLRMGKQWGLKGSAPTFSPNNFGMGGAQGPAAAWANQGVKETSTQQITNNTSNSVSVSATGVGLKEVADMIAAKVKEAMAGFATKADVSNMGASIAKGNTTPTSPTLVGP